MILISKCQRRLGDNEIGKTISKMENNSMIWFFVPYLYNMFSDIYFLWEKYERFISSSYYNWKI